MVGIGQQRFLDPALTMMFYRNGIGIEVMDTRAACRTGCCVPKVWPPE